MTTPKKYAGCTHQRQLWKDEFDKNVNIYIYELLPDIRSTIEHALNKHEYHPLGSLPNYIYSLDETIPEHYRRQNNPYPNGLWVRHAKDVPFEQFPSVGLLTKPCPVCGYHYGTAWLKEDDTPYTGEELYHYFHPDADYLHKQEKRVYTNNARTPITIDGVPYIDLKHAARQLNMPYSTLTKRYNNVKKPGKDNYNLKELTRGYYFENRFFKNKKQLAEYLNLTPTVLYKYLKKGLPLENIRQYQFIKHKNEVLHAELFDYTFDGKILNSISTIADYFGFHPGNLRSYFVKQLDKQVPSTLYNFIISPEIYDTPIKDGDVIHDSGVIYSTQLSSHLTRPQKNRKLFDTYLRFIKSIADKLKNNESLTDFEKLFTTENADGNTYIKFRRLPLKHSGKFYNSLIALCDTFEQETDVPVRKKVSQFYHDGYRNNTLNEKVKHYIRQQKRKTS